MQLFNIDLWQEIFATLRRHKLRTALTAFGVFWGIFILVVLMGAGKGLQNGAEINFPSITNSVYLWSSRPTSMPYKGLGTGRTVIFTVEDLNQIKLKIPDIKGIGAINYLGNVYAVNGSRAESFNFQGVHPETLLANGMHAVTGRMMNQLDVDQKRKVVVIGSRVREVLFAEDEQVIGKYILIRGLRFLVVGVVAHSATNDGAKADEATMFIPHSTLMSIFNQGNQVHSIVVISKLGVNATITEQKVKKLLMDRHKVNPEDHGVVGSFNVQEQLEQVKGLFTSIRLFSWLVAIGTLIAGVVGVGNIMMIAVKERTKEIGIRKALGATPKSIISMIVQESMLITFFAGYLGLVVGVLLIESIAIVMKTLGADSSTFSRPEIDFSVAVMAIIVLLVAGMIAALLPARKAAKVDPVIALQDQ